MALSVTMYRFDVDVSDVDRNVYEKLELRVAQHPSETVAYLLTRVLAYCLSYEEGIQFSRGLAMPDEPAVWVKDLQGTTQAWIEVGTPSAERLHKATKAVKRVSIYTQHSVELLQRNVRGQKVHRMEDIEVFAVEPTFLSELESVLERSNTWSISRNDGEIYVAAKDKTFNTQLAHHTLGEPS